MRARKAHRTMMPRKTYKIIKACNGSKKMKARKTCKK